MARDPDLVAQWCQLAREDCRCPRPPSPCLVDLFVIVHGGEPTEDELHALWDAAGL